MVHIGKKEDLIIIAILCAILVLGCAVYIVQNGTDESSNIRIISLVLIGQQYSDSNDMLEVHLQYFGDTLESVSGEDFDWYLNGRHMGSACLISPTEGSSKKLESGFILQIGLKTEEIPPGNRIRVTFRNGFQIDFTT